MTKAAVEEIYGSVCQNLTDEANKLCGEGKVFIGPKEYPYGTMLYLSYGDKEVEFNPDGYNYLYNLKRLTNNEVIDAILE